MTAINIAEFDRHEAGEDAERFAWDYDLVAADTDCDIYHSRDLDGRHIFVTYSDEAEAWVCSMYGAGGDFYDEAFADSPQAALNAFYGC